jgi:hypothetical protein
MAGRDGLRARISFLALLWKCNIWNRATGETWEEMADGERFDSFPRHTFTNRTQRQKTKRPRRLGTVRDDFVQVSCAKTAQTDNNVSSVYTILEKTATTRPAHTAAPHAGHAVHWHVGDHYTASYTLVLDATLTRVRRATYAKLSIVD